MKYLAMLKDSLYEAIDTKVFYFMLGLSGLMILAAFSMSFERRTSPGTMARVLQQEFWMNEISRYRERSDHGPNRVQMQQVTAVADGGMPDGPDESYRVQAHLHVQSDYMPRLRAELTEFMRRRLTGSGENKVVDVSDVRIVEEKDPFGKRPGEDGKGPAADEPPPGHRFLQHHLVVEFHARPTSFTRMAWPHHTKMFFGAWDMGDGPVGQVLFVLENYIISGVGAWITIIVSIIITAFFIPNMLRKGTVDLLLVKPIARWRLLLYKYIGGLTFVFLNTVVAVGGLWLVLSWKTGVWAPGFLVCILVITFFFAILYAVCTLFGVLTQSPISGILIALMTLGLLVVIGWFHWRFEVDRQRGQAPPDTPMVAIVDGLHFVLPRVRDLDYLTAQVLSRDLLTEGNIYQMQLNIRSITWGESLTVSAIFVVLMLGLACWRFTTRDY